jgi:hypothetical protein
MTGLLQVAKGKRWNGVTHDDKSDHPAMQAKQFEEAPLRLFPPTTATGAFEVAHLDGE